MPKARADLEREIVDFFTRVQSTGKDVPGLTVADESLSATHGSHDLLQATKAGKPNG